MPMRPKYVCHDCGRVVRLERKQGHGCVGRVAMARKPLLLVPWKGSAKGRSLSILSKKRVVTARRYALL